MRTHATAAALAAAVLAAAAPAAAAGPRVVPFDVTGLLQAASRSGTTQLSGGTLRVNGQTIVVPDNTIVLMPASALSWSELFELAPAPYAPNATGMALTDFPAPMGSYEVHVQGNQVGDQYIAGLVSFSQHSLMTGQGVINAIDYVNGELRVGGTLGDPTTGQRVRINDPIGRFGRAWSGDVRFTVDEDNPTVRAETAFPMCLPRTDPAVQDDALCPRGNRPYDATLARYPTIFTMPAPGAGVLPDARRQAPFEVGDFVTYSGVLMKDGAQPTVGPAPVAGTFVAAYSVIANVAIFTAPGVDPAYIALDVTILGVAGIPDPLAPQEATTRTRFEGFSTDPSRVIDLWGMDVDPCTGATTDRHWGTIGVDPGPPTGAVLGRWRFRPPTRVLAMPATGTFLPATREVRAVIRGAYVAGLYTVNAANGLVSGQYHAPITAYLFPENLAVGGPLVPLNLNEFPFLAQGSGPWSGGGPRPISSGVVGQLAPWPGGTVPPPAVCAQKPPQLPVADAGPSQIVASGAVVALDGSASAGFNGQALTFAWTQTAGPAVLLSGASDPRPFFTAPTVASGQPAVSLGFQLVVSDGSGASAPAAVSVTVEPAPAETGIPVASAGSPQTVRATFPVQLDARASFDPGGSALTFAWTQIVGPPVALAAADTATPTFTAPAVAAPTVLTFHVTVTNVAGLSDAAQVDVTVMPLQPPVAIAPNQTVGLGAAVTLDGSASLDPNGLALTYAWSQVSGIAVALAGAGTATPTFTAPATAGTLGFTLVVTDAQGLASTPTLVTVTVAPASRLTVTLAQYRTTKQRLTVNVTSSVISATEVLTLIGYGANGVQLQSLGNGLYTAILTGVPLPASVTVTSNLGGSVTAPVSLRP